jgi:hypothetical protein
MNEADRIIRERLASEKSAVVARAKADKKSASYILQDQVSEARRLIAEILAQMKRKDYPEMVAVMVTNPRFGAESGTFGYTTKKSAGWVICEYIYHVQGDPIKGKYYLLSNGLLNDGRSGPQMAIDDNYVAKYLPDILTGLTNLQARLA